MPPPRILVVLAFGLVAGAALGYTFGVRVRTDAPAVNAAPKSADPAAAVGRIAGSPPVPVAVNAGAAAPGDPDFQSEARRIDLLPAGSARDAALASLLAAWMRHDAAAALPWLRALPLADQKRHLAGALTSWSTHDPKAALDYARALPAGLLKRDAVDRVLRAWAKADGNGAINYARGLPAGRDRAEFIRTVVNTLSSDQPEIAAALLGEIPATGNRSALAESIGAGLVRSSGFGAGFQWAMSLGSRDERQAAVKSVVNEEIMRGDPVSVLNTLLQISDGNFRGELISSALYRLAQDDAGAALALLNQLPTAEQNPAAWRGIIAGWAATDPAAAADFARSQLSGPNYEEAIRAAMWAWNRMDPRAASQFAALLADTPARIAVWRQSTWALASTDQSAAANFVNSLPDSLGKDQAMGAMARELARNNPSAALPWVNAIVDDNVRNFATRGVYLQWFNLDPGQAALALQASTLTPDQKAAITSAVANGGGRWSGGR